MIKINYYEAVYGCIWISTAEYMEMVRTKIAQFSGSSDR